MILPGICLILSLVFFYFTAWLAFEAAKTQAMARKYKEEGDKAYNDAIEARSESIEILNQVRGTQLERRKNPNYQEQIN